jgi:hypothetical protein
MNLKTLDKFVNKFSELLNENQYDYCLEMLTKQLKKGKFAMYTELWNKLYLKNLESRKSRDIILGQNGVKIPICKVTKHNHILAFYLENCKLDNNETIWRVDTHSDLNPIADSRKLKNLADSYRKTRAKKYLVEAQKLVWDIGAAKSGVLFTIGIHNLVWGLPSWVPDKQISINYIIKETKRNLHLTSLDDLSHKKNMDEWGYTQTTSKSKSKNFYKIQTGRLTKKGYSRLRDALKNGSNKNYILDIDLDYFVSNGEPFTKRYYEDSYDLCSYYRTKDTIANQKFPRNALESSRDLDKYNKDLISELKIIDVRIKIFFNILKKLKKESLTPSLISICDSTNVIFNNCNELEPDCNSLSNGYLPMYFALYIHNKIDRGLRKLISKN